MSFMHSTTTAMLVAAIALAVAGCGGADKPDGVRASSDPVGVQPAGSAPPAASVVGNGVDRAFVAAMVPHHRAAVAMARIARRQGTSTFVKRFAGDIVTSQSKEISAMRREDKALKVAGVKRGALGLPARAPGMIDADLRMLRSASPFDPAFLRMMTAHHQGAIEIARVEIAKGKEPDLRTLAANIIAVHKRELGEMRDQLGRPAAGRARPVPPIGDRDPRSGSPDMPGVDDNGLPAQTE